MDGCNPVMSLVKLPVPEPFLVKSSSVVGEGVVAQQMPRTETLLPPSSVIKPPDTAVVELIEVTSAVERVAVVTGSVVNESSSPYDVPSLFVA